jgi:hypothetical protein
LSLSVGEAIGGNRSEWTHLCGVPGHHRPNLAKQLKCQPLHCGTSYPQARHPASEIFSATKQRGWHAILRPKSRRKSPKAAAFGGIDDQIGYPAQTLGNRTAVVSLRTRSSETTVVARALGMRNLPPRKQSAICLRFGQ